MSEFFETYGRVDLYTGTLGKAFGRCGGRFHHRTPSNQSTCSASAAVPISSPTPFPPSVVGAGIETFKILDESNEIHDRLVENVEYSARK